MNKTLVYGFAIFSMFFGSGNLVFPLELGFNSESGWLYAFAGFFLTGIVLPFLGLFVVKLHRGDCYKFFAEAGSFAKFLIPIFTLSLLGSFGVVPRCITVAHGGMQYIFPSLQLLPFSLCFSLICFVVCLNDSRMVSVLGKFLTPILLISLIFLITFGVLARPDFFVSSPNLDVFSSGFFSGYATMDLFAAFFFSALIFKQIENSSGIKDERKLVIAALKPSLIGAAILAFVYLGFIYLGAHFKDILIGVAPELMLPTIATSLLGSAGALLIATIIILSCLTTAVSLNGIYARFLCDLFKIRDSYFSTMLFATTTTSFAISLLDFGGIAELLSPLLSISYPSLIVLTILSIFIKGKEQVKTYSFYAVLLITIIFR